LSFSSVEAGLLPLVDVVGQLLTATWARHDGEAT
jgi:hypothetical protein